MNIKIICTDTKEVFIHYIAQQINLPAVKPNYLPLNGDFKVGNVFLDGNASVFVWQGQLYKFLSSLDVLQAQGVQGDIALKRGTDFILPSITGLIIYDPETLEQHTEPNLCIGSDFNAINNTAHEDLIVCSGNGGLFAYNLQSKLYLPVDYGEGFQPTTNGNVIIFNKSGDDNLYMCNLSTLL
jgi:hypothetical protein